MSTMKLELIIALLSTTLFYALASDSISAKQGHKIEPNNNQTIVFGDGHLGMPSPLELPGGGGNTHVITWNNAHYKYHGQCDLVMMKDEVFAEGLGLNVHIRTKIVGYWSYIKTVAIKIGNDVLEIEGSADSYIDDKALYWINYAYQGELENVGGFPVTVKQSAADERSYTIDFSSKYKGQEISVQVYKEFVRIKFNGKEDLFGNAVGLLGDYTTGNTYARDGVTDINDDFVHLGDQWQVLPYERQLFREAARPQFPELCWKPKDPRGARRRHLAESNISYGQAEVACFRVMSDPLSIKDCVNDILATQDLDMVGAYH